MFFPLLLGYTVTSVVSAQSGQLYVAGAPRFNHTGKVIVFTLKNTGELTILHSLKGHQVKVWLTHMYVRLCLIACTFTCIFYTHWISSSSKDFVLINYLACTHCLSQLSCIIIGRLDQFCFWFYLLQILKKYEQCNSFLAQPSKYDLITWYIFLILHKFSSAGRK